MLDLLLVVGFFLTASMLVGGLFALLDFIWIFTPLCISCVIARTFPSFLVSQNYHAYTKFSTAH